MWDYSELHSCPLVIVIDAFKTHGFEMYVTLPLLNYRLNVLRKNNDYRIVHNRPLKEWLSDIEEACMNIVFGNIDSNDFQKLLYINTMFYGGLNIHMRYGEGIIPVSIDYIDKSRFNFYLKPHEKIEKIPRISPGELLSNWLLLQIGLREGIKDIVFKACKSLSVIQEECVIETSHGLLKIASSNEILDNWLRVVPDNNPFRHVVLKDI
ncbi:MAG: hypothetical protein QXS23_02265 [Desulfurococcaceae archaeon]